MCLINLYYSKRRFILFVLLFYSFSLFSQGNVISNAEYQIKIFDERGTAVTDMINLNAVSNQATDSGGTGGGTGAGTGTGTGTGGTGGGSQTSNFIGNLYSYGTTNKLYIKSGYTFKLFSNHADLPEANGGQTFAADKWGVSNPSNVTERGVVGTIKASFQCSSINLFIIKGPDGKNYYYLNFSTKNYTEIDAPVFAEFITTSTKEVMENIRLIFRRNNSYGSIFTASFPISYDIDRIWFGIPSDNSGNNFWWFNTDEPLDPNTWSREIVASETKGSGTQLNIPGNYYFRVGIGSNKKEDGTENNFKGLKIRVENFGPASDFVSKAKNFYNETQGKTIIVGTHLNFNLKKIEPYSSQSTIYFYNGNNEEVGNLRGVFGEDLNLDLILPNKDIKKCKIVNGYQFGTLDVYQYESDFMEIVTDTIIENKVELVASNKMINSSTYGGVCADLDLRVPSKNNGETPIYPYDNINLYQYNKKEYQNIDNAKKNDSFYEVEQGIKIDESKTFNRKEVIYQHKDLADNTDNVNMGYCAETHYSGNLGFPKSVKYASEIKDKDYNVSQTDKFWDVVGYDRIIYTEIQEKFTGEGVTTGIEKVNSNVPKYSIRGNTVIFPEYVSHIAVYNLSGMKVAESSCNEVNISVKGIYILKTDNDVVKVIL